MSFFQNGSYKRLGLGIGTILVLVGCLTAWLFAEPTSDYEALRLFTEALDEISQKIFGISLHKIKNAFKSTQN